MDKYDERKDSSFNIGLVENNDLDVEKLWLIYCFAGVKSGSPDTLSVEILLRVAYFRF